MTEDHVKKIATEFVTKDAASHARAHAARPFQFTLFSARPHPELQGQWVVVFTVKTPDGHVMDCEPDVVLVDDLTGVAKFLD